MKYRRLPLEDELVRLESENPEEVDKVKSAYLLETLQTRGFQLVTGILRNQEKFALDMLRTQQGRTEYFLGWLQSINEVRRLITSLLPESAQAAVDWSDQEEEAFLVIDQSEPSSGEVEV
jgi:hypothetical protein